ncbi:MAG TPA: hypothetical protein VMU45_08510 [Candidatus Eisenbacteria bacterium]|nr:hypothetical protein [Candidatus Eisenbacteria bacterium]
MRIPRLSLVAVLCISTLASADLKIKTRTTVMGHTSDNTVYIKGPRQRTEISFGGRGSSASIMQCDQKRMITVMGDRCMVMPFGKEDISCPAMPNMRDMLRGKAASAPARAGGVVTITRTSTDTGERQDMFGYKARHIKSTMIMESSPDACNQSHMRMEVDGWYAELSTAFSCGDESYRAMACGGQAEAGCHDRIVMKGGGAAPQGYPLKQTMTVTTNGNTSTITTEVLELTNTTLEASLFDAPPGCKSMDMSEMMGSAPPAASRETTPAASAATTNTAAPAPPAAPAPVAAAATVAPRTGGVVRVGVVKINDKSGQSLPTNNLRLNLMSEFGRQQLEAIPLEAESPQQDVASEAQAKQCDYFVYTVPTVVKDAGTGGIPPASLPKGVALDPAKYQALTLITLYKVGTPSPELKDLPLAADANALAVNAVMETFVKEADTVAKQIADDAHPKPAAKSPPPKRTTTKPKQ